jgi:hypothetical protein
MRALFGCICIHFDSHMLKWNEIKFSLIPSIYFHACEFRRIHTHSSKAVRGSGPLCAEITGMSMQKGPTTISSRALFVFLLRRQTSLAN